VTVNKRAECPLCGRVTGTFVHNRRRIFQHHYAEGRTNAAIVCDASGWIVEDHELRVVPRQSPLKDAAQPARSVCRGCVGEGIRHGDLCPRCTGTGSTPSPVPQENNQ